MSEPYVPEPAPERDGYHDLSAPRCPTCRSILDLIDAYGHEGKCPEHGIVMANYSFPEIEEEERSDA